MRRIWKGEEKETIQNDPRAYIHMPTVCQRIRATIQNNSAVATFA